MNTSTNEILDVDFSGPRLGESAKLAVISKCMQITFYEIILVLTFHV